VALARLHGHDNYRIGWLAAFGGSRQTGVVCRPGRTLEHHNLFFKLLSSSSSSSTPFGELERKKERNQAGRKTSRLYQRICSSL
jgi:hypothetical protein